jgi:hypothetical protein
VLRPPENVSLGDGVMAVLARASTVATLVLNRVAISAHDAVDALIAAAERPAGANNLPPRIEDGFGTPKAQPRPARETSRDSCRALVHSDGVRRSAIAALRSVPDPRRL